MSNNSNKNNILNEEKYVDTLRTIITRDFYPDLPVLRNQLEWMNAVESNDIEKMAKIQFNSIIKDIQTPILNQYDIDSIDNINNNIVFENKRDPTSLKLDQFLNNYSSEDDFSFKGIQEKQITNHRIKYHWFFDSNEKEGNKQLLLTYNSANDKSTEEIKLLTSSSKANNVYNQLMYIPTTNFNQPTIDKKEIIYQNTRLPEGDESSGSANVNSNNNELEELKPFDGMTLSEQLAYAKKLELQGLGFLATPASQSTPLPTASRSSIEQSPLMTWGKVDGTPMILPSGGMTPRPSFRIPDTPRREILAQKLSEKFNQKSSGNQTPQGMKGVSPAIQKHFERKQQNNSTPIRSDDQLRMSYNSPQLKKQQSTPVYKIPKTPTTLPSPMKFTKESSTPFNQSK